MSRTEAQVRATDKYNERAKREREARRAALLCVQCGEGIHAALSTRRKYCSDRCRLDARLERERPASQTPEGRAQMRNRKLLQKYGIDQAAFEELLAHQGNVCPICLRSPDDVNHTFHIDHDHVTGYIRGATCGPCNRYRIGRYRRGHLEPLERTLTYLMSPPALALWPGRRVSERRPNGRKWADA